jgi:glycosyltransferase involved in cell wall biosynthesis
MRVAIVSDAWHPQVNGVVRTLTEMRRELTAQGHTVVMITPEHFRTIPCPTYPEIRLSLGLPGTVGRMIEECRPDAVHISTEGPLGWAARRHCVRTGRRFTTAYHTRFPEYVHARFGVPLAWSHAVLRRFHGPAEVTMVPTASMIADLEHEGFDHLALWSRGVDVATFTPDGPGAFPPDTPRPIFLYVGRVAVEKNIGAFLDLDLPGTKWVVGDGPGLANLKQRHPGIRWSGIMSQTDLARHYRHADVFVFPSLTDTFGLVLLEALACGTPVAAYPVTGPLEVISDSPAGALDNDLKAACLRALTLSRNDARSRAEQFSWAAAAGQFAANLRPAASARNELAAAL